MRIAVVNWSRRKVGGIETYLGGVIPELLRAGHDVAFWHEVDLPLDRERITIPDSVPVWSVEELGADGALDALRGWRPDLIYAHGLHDPSLEAKTLRIAPSVFFAHTYYGTCISGAKTFKRPVVRPCQRQFGLRCMLQYYPRRCGGWSPLTMVKEYRRQAARLELLHGYSAIVTHSAYIQSEFIKHGLSASSAYKFPYYVHSSDKAHDADGGEMPERRHGEDVQQSAGDGGTREWRLLFLGRMDLLKGGGVLLDALPLAASSLGTRLRVTMAGDGPARHDWEQHAARLAQARADVRVEFTGWLNSERIENLMGECDLLVLPSLWPEPFGLVGPEAGLRGVPVAAFGVGGISDWLVDGVNGYAAPGDPPTATGLAEVIVKCLADPATRARLSLGAREVAQRFSIHNHITVLLEIFKSVVRGERGENS